MNTSLLIIGKPHSSKTVFITQLYSRLQKGKGQVTLSHPVDDLTPITSPRERIAQGNEPETTPTIKSVNLKLPIKYKEKEFELHCPDYGGEQINRIITTRQLDRRWKTAIKKSDSWILFIRINSISLHRDISTSNVAKESTASEIEGKGDLYSMTEQSSLIELLQIILDSKDYDYHFKNSKVKLTVVLTCWDELQTSQKPVQVLKENLPLLLAFIESNWNRNMLKIIGLSAQGFSLEKAENKEKYEIEGPENFGFVIKEDGSDTPDLTELILQALQWE